MRRCGTAACLRAQLTPPSLFPSGLRDVILRSVLRARRANPLQYTGIDRVVSFPVAEDPAALNHRHAEESENTDSRSDNVEAFLRHLRPFCVSVIQGFKSKWPCAAGHSTSSIRTCTLSGEHPNDICHSPPTMGDQHGRESSNDQRCAREDFAARLFKGAGAGAAPPCQASGWELWCSRCRCMER